MCYCTRNKATDNWRFVTHHCQCLSSVHTARPSLSAELTKQVTWLASLRSEVQVHVCLPVRGAPWWAKLQHCVMLQLFFLVKCGIVCFLCAMRVFEVRASSSCLGYLWAKFHFFRDDLHCWASPWRKIAYSVTHSVTHSPSLFDAPGRACALEHHDGVSVTVQSVKLAVWTQIFLLTSLLTELFSKVKVTHCLQCSHLYCTVKRHTCT